MLSLTIPAMGQGLVKDFESVFWDGDRQVVIFRGGRGTHCAEVLSRENKVLVRVKSPAPFLQAESEDDPLLHLGSVDYAEGNFYCLQNGPVTRDQEGTFTDTRVLIHEENKWREIARSRFRGLGPRYLWRLGNGKFLGVTSSRQTFVSQGRSYPFAILRIDERDRLQVDSCMDLDLEKPLFNGARGMAYEQLLFTFLLRAFTRTPDRIVFASPLGLFWVFDSSTGSLKRVILRLYPNLTDARIESKAPLLAGLLGFGARPDNQILISARHEDAVLNTLTGASYPAAGDPMAQERLDAIHRANPLVDWWVADPETGKVTMVAPPHQFPQAIRTEAEFRNFNWRFKPDGVNLDHLNFEQRFGKSRPPAGK